RLALPGAFPTSPPGRGPQGAQKAMVVEIAGILLQLVLIPVYKQPRGFASGGGVFTDPRRHHGLAASPLCAVKGGVSQWGQVSPGQLRRSGRKLSERGGR